MGQIRLIRLIKLGHVKPVLIIDIKVDPLRNIVTPNVCKYCTNNFRLQIILFEEKNYK